MTSYKYYAFPFVKTFLLQRDHILKCCLKCAVQYVYSCIITVSSSEHQRSQSLWLLWHTVVNMTYNCFPSHLNHFGKYKKIRSFTRRSCSTLLFKQHGDVYQRFLMFMYSTLHLKYVFIRTAIKAIPGTITINHICYINTCFLCLLYFARLLV